MFDSKGREKAGCGVTIKFLPGLELCPSSIPLRDRCNLKTWQLWLRWPRKLEERVLKEGRFR